MAISLGFGLVFATLITLVLVPSLYLVTEDVTGLLGRRRQREPDTVEDVPRLPEVS